MSTIIPEPTYSDVLTIPAGLDETRLAVADYTGGIAEMTWRPSDNYQPGPTTWEALHRLGYDRRSPWQPEPLGFRLRVERIASPSENPSDDDNEADDGQDGPNDAHVRSSFYFSSFSVVCSKCDISAAMASTASKLSTGSGTDSHQVTA